jgi:hypothetical protein
MRKKIGMSAAVVSLGLALWALGPSVDAQKTKGKTRPAETKSLMKGIVQHGLRSKLHVNYWRGS